MNKIVKYLFLQIILAGCVNISNVCFAIEGFWIPEEINWKTVDVGVFEEGVIAKHKFAYINILYFKNDGDFKIFSGEVTLGEKTGYLTRIAYGFSIFEGTWKKEKYNRIAITYHLIQTTKGRREGEQIQIPGEDIIESLILDDASESAIKIHYNNKVYIRSDDRFTEKEREFMSTWTYEKCPK